MLIDIFALFGVLLLSLVVVFINDFWVLGLMLIMCLLFLLIFKVKITIYRYFIWFITIIFLFNTLLTNLTNASLVSIRLLIMFLSINIVSFKIGTNKIALLLGKVFHSRDLYLVVSIAFSFIPIMINELGDIKKCLVVRGYPLTISNFIKRPHVFFITFINNLFIKVKELEKIIISKGY